MPTRPIRKLLCANRGEIAIRVFRAANELGMRTVAVFSEEDATHQHRYKADEAYLIGRGRKPVQAYLAAEEIVDLALRVGADAIHPGYGFLAENADFADRVRVAGLAFVGPEGAVIRRLGDKVSARAEAERLGVPVVPGATLGDDEGAALAAARAFLGAHGPTLIKAAHGGGGRGMRVVEREAELERSLRQARSEALAAFGSGALFLEAYLPRVRHVEVQVLGDRHGNVIHLLERDCSVQRRHQKVVEIAPAPNLPAAVREGLFADALKLARDAGYHNAGTFEFLVAGDRRYFIEVNPRLQVEHTVTEQVTGVDIVQAQLLIEGGARLDGPEIGIASQADVRARGWAIQCRITTEDPANDFLPDTGTILAYRSPGGFGLRLDGGDTLAGTRVTGHYDSLLVKSVSWGPTLERAARTGLRALREFRIRGVKTNLPFLRNVLAHPDFLAGATYTAFVDERRELFEFQRTRDRATRLLSYLADVIVNGHPTVAAPLRRRPSEFVAPRVPESPPGEPPAGAAQILAERGPEGLAKWARDRRNPLLTDTTMRDAHQSLLATRVRTRDMAAVARATAFRARALFSVETWGGATFDVAYRYLNEDPWERLIQLKRLMPNLLQQMLLRGANAVGYTSYPDAVVEGFVDEAAAAGVDVFRVFDSLNDLDNMRVAAARVLRTGKVAELCVCYTGDVDNPARGKFSLAYYAELAKRIEGMGAHFLCVKDMAGLLRPQAARMLMEALRGATALPIHLHTHDTSGNGVATLMAAVETGVDVVDVALAPMAGLTSQPSMNALIAALRGSARETGMANKELQPLADYWEAVREFYSPFECGLKSSTSEVYYHEIPGGQYSNLRPQAASLGLLDRWSEVKEAFAVVNRLVGDIPKVTPSSKMVGDFAVFLVQNGLLVLEGGLDRSVDLTRARVLAEAKRLDFPQSVVQYFQGHLGRPPGGYPEDLRAAVLKGLPALAGRPSDGLPPFDFEATAAKIARKAGREPLRREVLTAALYPRVYDEHLDFEARHGDVSMLPTPVYFYGLDPGQEVWVEIEPGKTLVIELENVGEADSEGMRTVYFRLNGQGRSIPVADRALAGEVEARRTADPAAAGEVGAPMPGAVLEIHCAEGARVAEGDPLLTLEAMKMETIVRAPLAGTVAEIAVEEKRTVRAGDLLVVLEPG